MRLPDCSGPLCGQIPQYYPSLGIAGQEPGVFSGEANAVDSCRMAAKDVVGREWRLHGRHMACTRWGTKTELACAKTRIEIEYPPIWMRQLVANIMHAARVVVPAE